MSWALTQESNICLVQRVRQAPHQWTLRVDPLVWWYYMYSADHPLAQLEIEARVPTAARGKTRSSMGVSKVARELPETRRVFQ